MTGRTRNRKYHFDFVLLVLWDFMAVLISFGLSYYSRIFIGDFLQLVPLGHSFGVYLQKVWMPLLVLGTMAYYGGYGAVIDLWDDILIIMRVLCTAFLVTWMVLSLQKEAESVSRIIIVLAFGYTGIVLPAGRYIMKFILYKVLDKREEALLVGPQGKREEELIRYFNKEWYSGRKIVGLVSSDADDSQIINTCFMPVWNADETAMKRLKMRVKNIVLFTDITGLSFMNAQVKTYLSESVAVITSSNGLLSPEKVLLKRILDIVISLVLFILILPVFLCVSIVIRLESRGPVLFRHRRCGKNLKEFEMLKFRTMYSDVEGVLEKYLDENKDAKKELAERNKVRNDPRVTRFGRALRRTSFDEVPQLLNVIKGDMSFVGPRPDTREALSGFYEEYKEIYSSVKPGITGLWQVSGRSDVDYKKRVKLDHLYVLNWSVWLDFVIIVKTISTILSGKGAY